VEIEHSLIVDNAANLEELNRIQATKLKKVQKKLLKKVESVKNQYSFC